eukprot:c18874_g1_i1 orf=224-430(+)
MHGFKYVSMLLHVCMVVEHYYCLRKCLSAQMRMNERTCSNEQSMHVKSKQYAPIPACHEDTPNLWVQM